MAAAEGGASAQQEPRRRPSATTTTATTAAAAAPPPTTAAYFDFELLWLRARKRHGLGRAAAGWALDDVRAGVLPCDALALERRLVAILELRRALPGGVDTRRLVNRHRLALRRDAADLEAPARQLLRLLPGHPPTALVSAALAELPRRDPEALALAAAALSPAAQRALGGGLYSGGLFSALLRLADAGAGAAELEARMAAIAELLGPELAHAALASLSSARMAARLLELEPSELAARLAALSDLLERPAAVDAALLAARAPPLLAAPPARVHAAAAALVAGLGDWLGWRRGRALHFLAWNPEVLAAVATAGGSDIGTSSSGSSSSSTQGSGALGAHGLAVVEAMAWQWREASALAAARPRWAAALARSRYPLVSAVLCGGSDSGGGGGGGDDGEGGDGSEEEDDDDGGGRGEDAGSENGPANSDGVWSAADDADADTAPAAWRERQRLRLERLRYCAESGELPRLGLRRVLLAHPVDFAARLPGYRAWRLRRERAGGVAARAPEAVIAGGGSALPPWWDEPQIEVLGELGPHDRL